MDSSYDQRRFPFFISHFWCITNKGPFYFVNSFFSLQMFGKHDSNIGPWIFRFIPIRHRLGNKCCRVTPAKTLSDSQSLLERIGAGMGGWSRVRCDKRSNGGVGRKMVVKRDEWKLNYHLQRIKYG